MMAMKATLESLDVGDTFLNKYQIRGLLGHGGQAAVFHGYDTFIDRDVAIKIMSDSSDCKRERSRRAQMEARVLCKIHHPNIVRVFDAGTTNDGLIYIIMELLHGCTLREIICREHKVTVLEALSLGAQIAEGVELAHQQHVIHRDLKPENVFVIHGNAVKVLDFGIAKFLTLTGITTQCDTLQGTMWYISPEHYQGFGVTARSDIYALGSILYEIIAGTPPCLIGLQEITTQSVAFSQVSRMPPQLHELVPTVPAHVGRVIYRMLMKDPAQRYGSMRQVAVALRAASQRLQAEHQGVSVQQRQLWRSASTAAARTLPMQRDIEFADTLEKSPNCTADSTDRVHPQRAIQSTVEMRVSAKANSPAPATVWGGSGVVPHERPLGIPPAAHGATRANATTANSRLPRAQRWRVVGLAVVLGIVTGVVLGVARSRTAVPRVNSVDTVHSEQVRRFGLGF